MHSQFLLVYLASNPLDVHAQVPSDSTVFPYQCSAAPNKTNLPCYFYFNSFCNKGERCPFLHGPSDSAITGSSLKTGVPPLDRKTSVENDGGAAQTDIAPNSKTGVQVKTDSKTAPNSVKDTGVQLKVDVQQSVPKTMIKKSVSPKTSVFELGQAGFVRSQSLLLKEGTTQARSPICTDESSEEQLDDHIEPEERWESSPGFDVLVDNKSDDLDYENDSDYPLEPEGEQREYFSYDYEDSIQHDVEFSYDRDVYNAYEGSDNEYIFDNARNPSAHLRDRRLGSIFPQKRRLLPVELSVDVDLREYLSSRRVVEGNPLKCLSRSEYSHLINQSLERPQRRSVGRKSSRRLESKVGKHSTESTGGQGGVCNGTNRRGWVKCLEPNRSIKRPYREKRLPRRESIQSKVYRNLVSRERKSKDASTAFTGPKTLAQIREEKRKTEESGGKTRHFILPASTDFQGPKPLSEILKDKERLANFVVQFLVFFLIDVALKVPVPDISDTLALTWDLSIGCLY
ncbi:Detected protein of unknown function [Hibiscus syriacus]|uniref:C3H1-type domain-containing protein n=1 Tax=Hibiscus syriacus TaxID=106335 RepID=A0A6A2Y4A7_HIBSY|nr:Detected protein of unknown function [Hibiscus syriacus]